MKRIIPPTLALLVTACGPAATVTPETAPVASPAAVTVASTPPQSLPVVRALPELSSEFEAEGVTGTIALFDSSDGVLSCSNVERCRQGFIPASTFKIPNSMIALETGLVEGPDTVMKWDGQQYSVQDWNQDLKFRDAFRLSCVPCYREIARKAGEQVEQEWVNKLDYGNHDISGGVDRFWLWGALRISPLQQIDFLRRFDGNELPISERTADIVRDIMTLDVTESYVLRAKSGATRKPDDERDLGWFVGWVELGERRVFFATLIDGHQAGVDWIPVRRRVTERILRARAVL